MNPSSFTNKLSHQNTALIGLPQCHSVSSINQCLSLVASGSSFFYFPPHAYWKIPLSNASGVEGNTINPTNQPENCDTQGKSLGALPNKPIWPRKPFAFVIANADQFTPAGSKEKDIAEYSRIPVSTYVNWVRSFDPNGEAIQNVLQIFRLQALLGISSIILHSKLFLPLTIHSPSWSQSHWCFFDCSHKKVTSVLILVKPFQSRNHFPIASHSSRSILYIRW